MAKGDTTDAENPFHFSEVVLNLMCGEGYDPSLPRVLVLRADGELATREVTFVDDIHLAGR